MTGTFDPYVSWKSRDEDGTRVVRATVRDKPSVADLLAFLDREAPGIDLADVHVSGGHIGWERAATAEERAEREQWQEAARVRQEEWERAALARFLAKYGQPEESV